MEAFIVNTYMKFTRLNDWSGPAKTWEVISWTMKPWYSVGSEVTPQDDSFRISFIWGVYQHANRNQ